MLTKALIISCGQRYLQKHFPKLINELTPVLLLIRGLCELLGQPLYNAEKENMRNTESGRYC